MKNKFLSLLGPIYALLGLASLPAIVTTGSTKSNIQSQTTGATVDGDEVISVHRIIEMAHQENPFGADNMTGPMGSGKPININTDLKRVIGNKVVIPTLERLGAPFVAGANQRNGFEERRRTGDFTVQVGIGWFGVGIDNTGKAQTILGDNWDDVTEEDLALRLAKQQSDDTMIAFRNSAVSDNFVVPNGKTIDTLGTGDTYSLSLVTKVGGRLRDIGATSIDARTPQMQAENKSSKIARHLQITTDTNARPIKTDSAYLQALQYAKDRGGMNNLFTGDYTDIDNQIIYTMQCFQHGGYGSIGCPLQPEALLGNALTVGTTTVADGGGTTAAAAVTPYVNWFENFSRFVWAPLSGNSFTGQPEGNSTAVTGALTLRDTYGYIAIVIGAGAAVASNVGKIALARYTTNTAAVGVSSSNQLSGLTFYDGAGNIGDFSASVWTTTGDGLGFKGCSLLSSAAVIPVGAKIYEVNSKGVPLAYGLGLGAMAAVCGYGRIPIPKEKGGGFATMARKTSWTEPHEAAFAEGLQVSWGVTPFLRPNAKAPNYVLSCFARKVDGFPQIP